MRTDPPRTVADVLTDLAAQEADHPYGQAQLQVALRAYHAHSGHDLTRSPVTLQSLDVSTLDPGYNNAVPTSVDAYRSSWVASGRLHGEDLHCQVAWFAGLVAAATTGALPPLVVHHTDGQLILVDGGHRAAAHQAAGLTRAQAYVVA